MFHVLFVVCISGLAFGMSLSLDQKGPSRRLLSLSLSLCQATTLQCTKPCQSTCDVRRPIVSHFVAYRACSSSSGMPSRLKHDQETATLVRRSKWGLENSNRESTFRNSHTNDRTPASLRVPSGFLRLPVYDRLPVSPGPFSAERSL